MTEFITAADLAPFTEIPQERAEAMIADAVAKATRVAPCITSDEFAADTIKMADLKRILRTAILRWNEASGAVESYTITAGPYSETQSFDSQKFDPTRPRRALYYPSEIRELRALCGAGKAFTVDMTGPHRRPNPLLGATINAEPGREPIGRSDRCLDLPGIVW